ncbi:anti-anti-sigma factor [Gammaproteobacteria bacterium 45_16_T64]|mgnify:CR=1 FL=1|nr:anti-anti-sigma factor [Gammaproteobacteria bacterium 45_16_T64]
MASGQVAFSRKQISGEVAMIANELTSDCIYTGLFGALDSARMAAVSDRLTELANEKQNGVAIIDLANVEAIDSAVAGYMESLARTLKFVGVKCIFCGISGDLARTMVNAGVGMGDFPIVRDLKSALKLALKFNGQEIRSI